MLENNISKLLLKELQLMKNKYMDNYIKLFRDFYNGIEKIDNLILKSYYNHYNYLLLELDFINNNEPLRILKKHHQKWEEDKEKINNEIIDLFDKIKKLIN